MRWRRLRKWAKWTCTLAAGAAAGVTALSRVCWCHRVTEFNHQAGVRIVDVLDGKLWVREIDNWYVDRPLAGTSCGTGNSPFRFWGPGGESVGLSTPWDWHAGLLHVRDIYGRAFGVSLWYPVLLAAVPGALLFYADRRRADPGSCRTCGYDRRGLAANAKCPECGAVPAAGSVR